MKMNNKKRAQAALEFLTTYGWAFLVILIMIGALAYFGVLNPSNLVPDTCTAGNGFTCTEYQAVTGVEDGDAVNVVVVNTLESIAVNTSAIVLSTTGTGCGTPGIFNISGGNETGGVDSGEIIIAEAGQALLFNLNCSQALLAGERFQGSVDIVYTPIGKSFNKTATVDISLKAQ